MFNEELMETAVDAFKNRGLIMGRVLPSGNDIVVNTTAYINETDPTWYGDIDLKTDKTKIQSIANELKVSIQLTPHLRFEPV